MTDNLLQGDQQLSNYLDELVGEGKKFKTPEDLAKGKHEADTYIKHMERQLDEMRAYNQKLQDDYNARAKLEEVMDQYASRLQQQQPPQQQPSQLPVVPKPSIDSAKIENLVSSKIQEHEDSKKQKENFDFVRTTLEKEWGSNFATPLKERTASLGLTEEFINDLARKHPQVLFKTLGVGEQSQKQTFQAPPKSEQRRDSFVPSNQKRLWSYYQNLKKSDPKTYWDPKTQVQIHHDAVTHGDEFYDVQ